MKRPLPQAIDATHTLLPDITLGVSHASQITLLQRMHRYPALEVIYNVMHKYKFYLLTCETMNASYPSTVGLAQR